MKFCNICCFHSSATSILQEKLAYNSTHNSQKSHTCDYLSATLLQKHSQRTKCKPTKTNTPHHTETQYHLSWASPTVISQLHNIYKHTMWPLCHFLVHNLPTISNANPETYTHCILNWALTFSMISSYPWRHSHLFLVHRGGTDMCPRMQIVAQRNCRKLALTVYTCLSQKTKTNRKI
jgi:hypothetical protein